MPESTTDLASDKQALVTKSLQLGGKLVHPITHEMGMGRYRLMVSLPKLKTQVPRLVNIVFPSLTEIPNVISEGHYIPYPLND